MEILRVKNQKIHVFSVIRRFFLFFIVFNMFLLFSGANYRTWGFKPPPTLTPPPSTRVSLPEKLKLETAPESWGLPINSSYGEIYYSKEYHAMVLIKINLKGLFPNHRYILSLNGKPWHESNKQLPQGYGEERYYDFSEIVTNDEGDVEKHLTLDLQSGKYNVKFFVKDPTNDWKVVLYNDFLIFTVK